MKLIFVYFIGGIICLTGILISVTAMVAMGGWISGFCCGAFVALLALETEVCGKLGLAIKKTVKKV